MNTAPPPIPCVWSDTERVFRPLGNFAKAAAHHYGDGEIVPLVPHLERSDVSHRHYFAMIKEAWENLPEEDALRYPTPEHLRKWALIKAGYHDQTSFVASSKAEALRLRIFVAAVSEDFAVVTVQGSVVTRYTAKSQSKRAMGATDFQASKDAVLSIVAQMIAVEPAQLEERARQIA